MSLARVAGERKIDADVFACRSRWQGTSPCEEDGWVGRELEVGEARIVLDAHVGRCIVTSRHPEAGNVDLPTLDHLRALRGSARTTEPLASGVYGGCCGRRLCASATAWRSFAGGRAVDLPCFMRPQLIRTLPERVLHHAPEACSSRPASSLRTSLRSYSSVDGGRSVASPKSGGRFSREPCTGDLRTRGSECPFGGRLSASRPHRPCTGPRPTSPPTPMGHS